MIRTSQLRHQFARAMPERLESGVLYVSVDFATSAHLCCCGCGREVVTPLSPTDWKMIFDGETVSLYPSVGNWSFPCRSHYWITQGYVRWAPHWTPEEIVANRVRDMQSKAIYYGDRVAPASNPVQETPTIQESYAAKLGRWLRQLLG